MYCFHPKFQLNNDDKNIIKTFPIFDIKNSNNNTQNPEDAFKFHVYEETQSKNIGSELKRSLSSQVGKVKSSKEIALVCVHELHYDAKPPLDIELPDSNDQSVTGLVRWMYYNKKQVSQFQNQLSKGGALKMSHIFAEEMKRLYNLMIPNQTGLYASFWPIPTNMARTSRQHLNVQMQGVALGDLQSTRQTIITYFCS